MSFGGQMVEMVLTVEMVETWHGDSLYDLPGGRRHQRQCLRHVRGPALRGSGPKRYLRRCLLINHRELADLWPDQGEPL